MAPAAIAVGASDVTFVVTDAATGAPVAGAAASGFFESESGEVIELTVVTDAQGRATFTSLPEGWLDVRVSHPTRPYVAAWSDVTVDGVSDQTEPMALVMGGAVEGRVVDGVTGTPVADVCASLYDADGEYVGAGACSDAQGHFRSSGVAAGTYRVRFSDDQQRYLGSWYGGATTFGEAADVAVTLDEYTDGVDASMRRGARITGTLRAEDGSVLDGWVEVWDAAGERWIATADAPGGSFSVGPLAAGDYTLQASAPDQVSVWLGGSDTAADSDRLTISAEQEQTGATLTGADFELQLGGVLSGSIGDEDGGMPGWACAEVYQNGQYLDEDCTDDAGEYRITGLPRGEFQVRFSGDDLTDEWFDDSPDRAGATTLTLTDEQPDATASAILAFGGTMTGRVLDAATGEPIAAQGCDIRAHLYVANQPFAGAPIDSACVTSRGRYRLDADEGDYTVEFSTWDSNYSSEWLVDASTYQTARVWHLVPDRTVRQDARLNRGASIAGVVRIGTTPADQACVEAYTAPEGETSYPDLVNQACTDEQGGYRLRGLLPGRYLLHVADQGDGVDEWHRDAASWEDATVVEVTAGQDVTGVDATLARGGRILADVVDETGVAVESCYTQASSTQSSRWGDCTQDAIVRGLRTGDYRVEISASGFVRQVYSAPGDDAPSVVHVEQGEDADLGRIVLQRGAVITGHITDEVTGEPRGGYVDVYPVGSNTVAVSDMVVAGTDGSYRIDTLPPGDYHVQVRPDGPSEWFEDQASRDAATVLSIAAGETATADFRVSRGHAISGRATVRSTGDPVAASVALYRIADGEGGRELVDNVLAGPDGRYRFGSLPDGTYVVSAAAADLAYQYYADARTWEQATPITVQGEDVAGIDFRMRPWSHLSGTVTTSTGLPLPNARPCLRLRGATWGSACGHANADGSYTVPIPAAGEYHLIFESPQGDAYVGEYYDDAPDAATARTITITQEQLDDVVTLTGYDASLARAPYTVSGTVTSPDGAPLAGVPVSAGGWSRTTYGYTDQAGRYELGIPAELAAGYVVEFGRGSRYVSEYFDDAGTWDEATSLTVDPADSETHHRNGVDAEVELARWHRDRADHRCQHRRRARQPRFRHPHTGAPRRRGPDHRGPL